MRWALNQFEWQAWLLHYATDNWRQKELTSIWWAGACSCVSVGDVVGHTMHTHTCTQLNESFNCVARGVLVIFCTKGPPPAQKSVCNTSMGHWTILEYSANGIKLSFTVKERFTLQKSSKMKELCFTGGLLQKNSRLHASNEVLQTTGHEI